MQIYSIIDQVMEIQIRLRQTRKITTATKYAASAQILLDLVWGLSGDTSRIVLSLKSFEVDIITIFIT